ncbi:phosphotransferase family protein [Alkalihalobacillus sp. CinArs1]|uniref:phosphotransferase family protein n=1 Tax=Alkalihalobacillus sp. CinArs1 TaxID=2995314 RepID=UPI0022DE12EB|nr:aminoglycoside phosphotransferase family protein [Alkalihalobacillus sp. CinArs1]
MTSNYKREINAIYPELTITKLELNTIGQNNDVVIVNENLVFRFPKYDEGILALKNETAVLEEVRKHVTLPVPFPTYMSLQTQEVGKVFAGYDLIEGEPFWKEEFQKITVEDKERIANQLGTFLSKLHSVPIEQSNAAIHHEVESLYVRIQNLLFQHMREDARKDVSNLFESFLEKVKETRVHKKRIHGDFGASNILWDPEKREITGIIDFGETEIGDPAYDFAGLLASYGNEFVERCLAFYSEREDLLERVTFYKNTFALQEALHGIEHNDVEAFESGICEYR